MPVDVDREAQVIEPAEPGRFREKAEDGALTVEGGHGADPDLGRARVGAEAAFLGRLGLISQ